MIFKYISFPLLMFIAAHPGNIIRKILTGSKYFRSIAAVAR